jgi:hypothetical protein
MEPKLDATTRAVFSSALEALKEAGVPTIVAGAFALNHHTGVWRDTKDLDIFCEPGRAREVLAVLASVGFHTYVEEKHWLGKAKRQGRLVDVIWGGGNWATYVDSHWFEHADPGRCAGVDVLFGPAEDIILSKAWVAGRERFDGADICHLILARGRRFDWPDVVARFGDHWQLLLQYLLLFRFVYPEHRDIVPVELIRDLTTRVGTPAEIADGLPFRGPLVDRYAYLHDLRERGQTDPREEIARRAGFSASDVALRRQLDTDAFDRGVPYRHPEDDPEPAESSPPA